MFTWVCPTCGKEWDLAVKECPECRDRPVALPPASRPAANTRFWLVLALATVLAVVVLVSLVRYRLHRPPSPTASARAELERSAAAPALPSPEAIPEPKTGAGPAASAAARDIEVAGVRMSYDAQNKPLVRAVIINHGDEELRSVTLAVTLRPVRSPADSPPLARFAAKVAAQIKPGESREIEAPLETFATLAAMPAWRELRVDVELR